MEDGELDGKHKSIAQWKCFSNSKKLLDETEMYIVKSRETHKWWKVQAQDTPNIEIIPATNWQYVTAV